MRKLMLQILSKISHFQPRMTTEAHVHVHDSALGVDSSQDVEVISAIPKHKRRTHSLCLLEFFHMWFSSPVSPRIPTSCGS